MNKNILFILVFIGFVGVLVAQELDSSSVTYDQSAKPSVSADYWSARYHPQVSKELFDLVNYPYFPGGRDFVRSGPVEIAEIYLTNDDSEKVKKDFESDTLDSITLLIKQLAEQMSQATIDDQAEDQQVATDASDSDEFKQAAGELLDSMKNTDDQSENEINRFRNYFEDCSELIFRWRQINESPTFMLELLRSVKLTETESGIYQAGPEIAVQIKRTIGSIAKLNKNFDFTCRITMESILTGEYPRAWLSRQEKQLADLKNRMILLKELNDKGSQVLGLGAIDRSSDQPKYSNQIRFEIIQMPDAYDIK